MYKKLTLRLLLATLLMLLSSTNSMPTKAANTAASLPIRKVVVFLQGINSTLTSNAEGASRHCPNGAFGCIKQELASTAYGYDPNTDFLEFSYKGPTNSGSVNSAGNWVANDYQCNDPSNLSLETSATLLRNMLVDYANQHPGESVHYVLVGHSLGGDVAFQFLSDLVGILPIIGSPSPLPINFTIDSIITIDSQLAGFPISSFGLSQALNLFPDCTTSDADPAFLADPAVGSGIGDLQVRWALGNATTAENTLVVSNAHAYGIKVYTLGNTLDTLQLLAAVISLNPLLDIQTVLGADDTRQFIFGSPCSEPAEAGCGHSQALWNPASALYIANEIGPASGIAICADFSTTGGSGPTGTPANANKVLVLSSTVISGCSSLEAQAALAQGLGVDIVSGAQWGALAQSEFASYRALILGDPDCQGGTASIDAADANKSVWGPVITGNTIIIGTDPVYHVYAGSDPPGPQDVITKAMAFATGASGQTGGYLDLSCYYAGTGSGTPVSILNGLTTATSFNGPIPQDSNDKFTVQGANCADSGHIIATDSAAPIGLADSDLSSWECSVHEGFDQWPVDFKVLALDEESSATYISPDGTIRGLPYILVRGVGVAGITPLTFVPPSGATGSGDTTTDPWVILLDSLSATFTISICTISGGCVGDPPAGLIVTLHVNGTTYTAPTNTNGVATFTITPPPGGGITTIFATYTDPTTGATVTSDTKFYQFTFDTTPPTTTASATLGSTSTPYPFALWTNQSVQVTLSATDNPAGSGVAHTYYAVDNPACTSAALANCTVYTGSPFVVNTEGNHTLTYFSVDNAGNVEAANTAAIEIDMTPPNPPTASVNPAPNAAGWNNSPATVSFTSNGDAGAVAGQSGVVSCTAPTTVSSDTAGTTVSGTCTDQAGNISTATSVTVKLDTTPPHTAATLLPAPNAAGWNNGPVQVTLNATDTGSGVQGLLYGTSGAQTIANTTVAGGTATLNITSEGQTSVTYAATDVAGNTEATESTAVKIDTTPPSCALTGMGINGSGQKYIQITVQDGGSGIGSITTTTLNNATMPVSFTLGDTNPVVLTATKIDQSQSAQVGLQITDQAGNVTKCDPVLTDLIRDSHTPSTIRATGIAQSEHLLHIYNGNPGLSHLIIRVNGVKILERDLEPNEQRTVDIGSALHPGDTNRVTVIARGKQRGEATLVIADS